MMIIENEFEIRDIVYIKTDRDQLPRQVLSIKVNPDGKLLYGVGCGTSDSWHWDFELSKEKNTVEAFQ